jgi:DNA-binding MarR family transcriptional regulator
VVIFDPLYLALVGGDAELDVRNLYDVGPLLADLTASCLDAGATPVLAHHARKNRAPDERWEPLELEDLAYAGVQEFARQWILISRRERYAEGTGTHRLWLTVGGSAGFGGLWGVDVEEETVGDDFRGRRWDVCVLQASEVRRHAASERERRKEGEQAVRLATGRQKVLAHFHGHPAAETRSGLSRRLGINKETLERVLDRLQEDGLVEPADVTKAGRRHEGLRLTDRASGAAAQAADAEARGGAGRG